MATTAPGAETDEALLAALATGDSASAQILVERHLVKVHGLAFRLLGSREEAEDVAQEVFLKAWRHAAKWEDGRAKFSTWLYRVTYNQAVDRLRRRREIPTEDFPVTADPAAGAEAKMVADGEARRLRAAMAQLPERQQAALALVYDQDMSGPEAAAVLGISIPAMDSLLARARRGLRAMLTAAPGDTTEADERHRPQKQKADQRGAGARHETDRLV